MSQNNETTETTETTETVRMEINGQPYYVKSKGTVPYLYDIDTNDEVGYWSSKKGQYIMFSLYNRMMKEKYESESKIKTSCSSDSTSESEKTETVSKEESGSQGDEGEEYEEDEEEGSQEEEEGSQEEEEGSQEEEEGSQGDEGEEESLIKIKNQTNLYSLMILFLMLFVYLILQRTFQSIHFDFIFLILVNLLNTLKVFEILNDE